MQAWRNTPFSASPSGPAPYPRPACPGASICSRTEVAPFCRSSRMAALAAFGSGSAWRWRTSQPLGYQPDRPTAAAPSRASARVWRGWTARPSAVRETRRFSKSAPFRTLPTSASHASREGGANSVAIGGVAVSEVMAALVAHSSGGVPPGLPEAGYAGPPVCEAGLCWGIGKWAINAGRAGQALGIRERFHRLALIAIPYFLGSDPQGLTPPVRSEP